MVLYENKNRNILETECVEISPAPENSIPGLRLSLEDNGNRTVSSGPGTVFLGKVKCAQMMCVSFPRTSAFPVEPDSPLPSLRCLVKCWVNTPGSALAKHSSSVLDRVAIAFALENQGLVISGPSWHPSHKLKPLSRDLFQVPSASELEDSALSYSPLLSGLTVLLSTMDSSA